MTREKNKDDLRCKQQNSEAKYLLYKRSIISYSKKSHLCKKRFVSAKRLAEFNERACFLKSCQIVVESVNEERQKVAKQEYDVPVTGFLPLPLLLRTRAHS